MMSSSVAAGDRPRVPPAPAPPPTRTRFAWLKNLSIRWKLMGAFGALIGAIVVFQMLYFPARQAAQAKVDLRAKGRSIASLVAHDVKAAFEFGDAKAVEEVFAGTRDDPDLAFLGLLDASGQRFASRGTAPGPLDTFASGAAREELSDQHFTLSLPVETAGGTHGMLVASFHLARITTRRREDQFTVVTTGLALLAGGLFVTFIVSSYVGRRLARFGRLTAGVAEGDLMPGEHALDTQADDEIGGLSRDLDRMVGNLRGMVHDIKEASVQVATSAEEISANSRRITERAQKQAGAADETATSMEQMATSIDAVAATAQSLASHVESTSTSIAQMGASIEHVARSSATLADTVAGTYVTIDEMATSIDQMAGRLERMAATASETTAPVEEVATFIGAVARSGESLAEAAQSTQATIAELALAVDDVARLAGEADRFSQKASDDARAGDQAVERAIAGMRRLSDTMDNTARVITRLGSRSLEIGRIVEVIEGIADQTNLLALNAAIEAARAGEAGRGFAVVADEVRKLAERSVTATSEIGDLVRQVQQETGDAVDTAKGGVAEAKEGIALADTAGLALRSIIESVTRSSALMGRIASATSTQSKASSEALETVSHMNQIAGEVTGSVRAQSEGSRRIRHAIETINHVMAEAAQSTKEQAVGGRLVRQAVDDMNRIASQLNVATKDQADGSRIIVSSVESMNRMTREVSRATSAQRATGEGVAHAVAKISSMARENLATVEETSRAIGNLVRQSEALAQLIAVFRS